MLLKLLAMLMVIGAQAEAAPLNKWFDADRARQKAEKILGDFENAGGSLDGIGDWSIEYCEAKSGKVVRVTSGDYVYCLSLEVWGPGRKTFFQAFKNYQPYRDNNRALGVVFDQIYIFADQAHP